MAARRPPKPSDSFVRPDVGSVDEQSRNHRQTRRAHETETAQDYVEAIADLIDEHGAARTVDLARRMGVSHVTVVKTVGRLQKRGFVSTKPYRAIGLTTRGRALAAAFRHRHRVTVAFLRALGIKEATARRDAEGIEHHLSEETVEAFEAYLHAMPGRPRSPYRGRSLQPNGTPTT